MKSTWKLDPAHSELFFKVKYLMISDVSGFITSFNLDILTEGNDFGQVTDLLLTADMNSLSTNNEQRDFHLKSQEFFDVENHRDLTFNGTKFEKQGMVPHTLLSAFRRDYKLYGNLTIKGITNPIILDGEFGGLATDTLEQKRAGFTVRGKISRKDFEMNWKGMTDAGKLILGDEVAIYGNIQLIVSVR